MASARVLGGWLPDGPRTRYGPHSLELGESGGMQNADLDTLAAWQREGGFLGCLGSFKQRAESEKTFDAYPSR